MNINASIKKQIFKEGSHHFNIKSSKTEVYIVIKATYITVKYISTNTICMKPKGFNLMSQ